MNINEYGAVCIEPDELFEQLYSGKIKSLKNLYLDKDTVLQFNQAVDLNRDSITPLREWIDPNSTLTEFDKTNQRNWFMPEEYTQFPLHKWLLDQCTTEIEKNRVDEELLLYIQYGMFDLLYYLKYLVDVMRENKIVWGVGRGSSVASYILFLIGVHKIDSLRYSLDIKEFLK